MYTIDIDTGGTMTDGLVSGDGTVLALKIETTPHDVTVSFLDVLRAAQEALDFDDLRSLLDEVAVIRWSSTITSNVLAERTGPKLGLLVTDGHADDLYDPEAAAAVVGTLVDADDISAIASDADEADVRHAVKALLDKGIRRINVSLADAFPDSAAEDRIVSMIESDYPDHYLGSIPALASSSVVLRPDDATRTVAALVNAYVHPALATTLYRAEEIVRDEHGWLGNVLVGHISGGVARIGKTKAFDTIESGPLFGAHACAATGGEHDDGPVLAIDVGGTTAKVSAVVDGHPVELPVGDLFGIPLELELPLLRSIALGGGSVARVADGTVTLGPDSMGAAPGPACYGLGGRNATITDAFVVLGLLSPTAFLDGRRTLDVDRAREALIAAVGEPLGLDVANAAEGAAQAVADAAWDAVADLARSAAAEAGWDPADCTVYGYGGNGPLFATAVADRLDADRVRLFRHGNVYSAYGSAISDVLHVYEAVVVDGTDLAALAARLDAQAHRDLRGEGFDVDGATFAWEVKGDDDTGHGDDVDAAVADLDGDARLVRLRASYPLPSLVLPDADPSDGDATPAGTRGGLDAFDADDLPGSTVTGPVLVDGGAWTWLVGDGWEAAVDARGDALLTGTS